MQLIKIFLNLSFFILFAFASSSVSAEKANENSKKNDGARKLVELSIPPDYLDEIVRQASEQAALEFENGFKVQLKRELTEGEQKRLLIFWYNKCKEILNVDAVYEILIPVVEKHLSEQEIEEINKFYNSTTGKKLNKLSAILSREGQASGERFAKKFSEDKQWMDSCLEGLEKEFPQWFPKSK